MQLQGNNFKVVYGRIHWLSSSINSQWHQWEDSLQSNTYLLVFKLVLIGPMCDFIVSKGTGLISMDTKKKNQTYHKPPEFKRIVCAQVEATNSDVILILRVWVSHIVWWSLLLPWKCELQLLVATTVVKYEGLYHVNDDTSHDILQYTLTTKLTLQ